MATFKNVGTYTIAEYKERNNSGILEVVKSPKTGKLFFVCGEKVGAVDKKINVANINPNEARIREVEINDEGNVTVVPILEGKSANVVRSF